jgi:hypothetical protein
LSWSEGWRCLSMCSVAVLQEIQIQVKKWKSIKIEAKRETIGDNWFLWFVSEEKKLW